MIKKLEPYLTTSCYLRYSYTYRLRNVENEDVILYHKNLPGSPWFNEKSEIQKWIAESENIRLNVDNIARPNTKWSFVRHIIIDFKIVLDTPPMFGNGKLPDELRWKKGIIALYTYNDNLCLFRCIAIGKGSRQDKYSASAKKLAREFYNTRDVPKTSLKDIDKIEEHFKLGIQVYKPNENGDWYLILRPAQYKDKITIEIYIFS